MSPKQWFPMKKTDRYFLLGLLVIVVLLFLPWTYEVTIFNISLLAWGAYLLHVLIPAVSIWLIKREKETGEEEAS